MKTLMAVCLLAVGATVAASPAPGDSARRDAEEARTRKQLDDARERLDKAAREVAELSAKLGAGARQDIQIVVGGAPRRAVLGIQVDDDPGRQGVRVLSVSPGGPAAEAGLRGRDIIIALDGKALPEAGGARGLVERMRQVKPDQKVPVRVLRDGKKLDYLVVARPLSADLAMPLPPEIPMPGGAAEMALEGVPMVEHFAFWPGEYGGLELASITPKLGAYFGVTDGVLVVSAPTDGAFKLEDGDVLQAIDGRKPEDGPHALRILRSYRAGEKLTVSVFRQRKPVALVITMPARPENQNFFGEPPTPEPPAAPDLPARPGTVE